MPLAEARGLLDPNKRPGRSERSGCCFEPHFVRHEPADDRLALRQLTKLANRFCPTVGVEEPDSLMLDVTGCVHLFGSEHALVQQVAAFFRDRGFFVHVVMADTVGAAWALGHYPHERSTSVASEQPACWQRLPVEALRLPDAAIEMLYELDIRRIKQLLSLPRTSLPSRFGPEVLHRLDQALGRLPELVIPVHLPEPIEASWTFEFPTRDRRALDIVLRRLVEQVVEKTVARQEGVQRLLVELRCSDRKNIALTVGMLRPSTSARHVTELILARWEQAPPVGEITRLRLKATITTQLETRQSQLFEDDGQNNDRELAQLIDRMNSRLGKDRVVRPRLRADAQPEFALDWEPLLDTSGGASLFEVGSKPEMAETVGARALRNPGTLQSGTSRRSGQFALVRPLRLYVAPVAVDVQPAVPAGPPVRFFCNRHAYTIVRRWGPERIETGWWRRRHVRRDYYRVETDDGRRFWLFQRIHQGDWFLHGEFE